MRRLIVVGSLVSSLALCLFLGTGGAQPAARAPGAPPAQPAAAAQPAAPAQPAQPAAKGNDKFPKGPYKNLKMFPKETPTEQLRQAMEHFSTALGVKCGFCHDTNDFAKDDKKHKLVSRDMMKATTAFNQALWKGKVKVTCMTCHRGEEEPEHP